MIINFKLNIMKKEKIKNRLLKLGILFFGILITFTNCEKEELIANDIQLAKNWFEKERISELDKNPFNNKNINWDKAILNNDGNIFVPIQLNREKDKLALIIDNNLRKDIFYQPYYILTKIDNHNFTYVFKVFFDKNNSSIAEDFNNHIDLPYITYGNQNETLNSSVNFYNKNKELISAKDGCVVIDWFIVTSINGVIISEEYVGSTVDCNSEGLDDGSEGGGGSTTNLDFICPNNFLFTSVTNNNLWQESIVNNVYLNMYHTEGPPAYLKIPQLTFGLPFYNSDGVLRFTTIQAQRIAADAFNDAELDVRRLYKQNPNLGNSYYENYWIERANFYMQSMTFGQGRVGRTGSINISQITAKNYEPCM